MTKKKLKRQVLTNLCLFTIIVTIQACTNSRTISEREIKLSSFAISVDQSDANDMKIYKDTTGNKGYLILPSIDTIKFNYGYSVDNLAEHDPAVFVFPYPADTITIDTTVVNPKQIVFTRKANYDIDEFRKQNIRFTSISGLPAKITFPRDIRKGGITGVYIDSVSCDYGGRLKFNFFANDLDSVKQARMMRLIQSIKLVK